jgi:hypothetical protein
MVCLLCWCLSTALSDRLFAMNVCSVVENECLAYRQCVSTPSSMCHSPSYFTPQCKLGALLMSMWRHKDAVERIESLVEDCKEVLGESDHTTLVAEGNLAVCLREVGRPADALAMQKKSLAYSRRVFGDGHHNTRSLMNNVAGQCVLCRCMYVCVCVCSDESCVSLQ